jgi:type IV secretion system protein VirB10
MSASAGSGAASGQALEDILPLVGEETGNRPMWFALGLIGLLGIILFAVLESRREAKIAPAIKPRAADYSATSPSVPELYVPPEPVLLRSYLPSTALAPQPRPPAPLTVIRPPAASARPRVPEARVGPAVPLSPPPSNTSPAVVYDGGAIAAGGSGNSNPADRGASLSAVIPARAHATRGRDQTWIVPQGRLIAAVLESALDSTQPGQVRALVSTDVANFDGTKILIPKGSRLLGDYRGELGQGQNRAQIQWARLIRPDGVTILLDSPAADSLGRSGVKGRVNSYFAQRLGGALLQSAIDVGALAAAQSISGSSVIVAVPTTLQGATSQLIPPPPKPTLKVRQGTRIAVFVARDLDFSGVGTAP